MTHLNLFALLAQAQGQGGGSAVPGGCGGGLMNLVPFLAIFAVFYLLLIRPQQKRARDHREMLTNLKAGDEIVTNGGVLGRITGLTDRYITIEVAEKIRLRVLRNAIMGRQADIKSEDVQQPQS